MEGLRVSNFSLGLHLILNLSQRLSNIYKTTMALEDIKPELDKCILLYAIATKKNITLFHKCSLQLQR